MSILLIKVALRVWLGLSLLMAAATAVAAQESWSARITSMEDKYFNKNQKPEAIADMQDAIDRYGNDYSDAQCDHMLAMLKEYFGVVSTDVNRFSGIVYDMYRGSEQVRIDHIVTYFEGKGDLYTTAKDARRRWYSPHHATLKLNRTQIKMGETTTYTIAAKNDEGFPAYTDDIDITTEDATIARVDGTTIRGLRPAMTMVIITNNQGIELDKKELEVLPGLTLKIDPRVLKMTEGEEAQFKVTANQPLSDGDLRFEFQPFDAASVKTFPVAPNSAEQHVEVTALVPSLDDYRLVVTGPENATTFSTVSIMMKEPVKPGKKWQLGASVVTLASFVWAWTAQSDANDKRDAEQQCVEQTLAPCPEEHQAYVDASNTATAAWIVTGVVAAGTGYLWYRYYKNIGLYKSELNEYKQYTSVDLEIRPSEVAVSIRF